MNIWNKTNSYTVTPKPFLIALWAMRGEDGTEYNISGLLGPFGVRIGGLLFKYPGDSKVHQAVIHQNPLADDDDIFIKRIDNVIEEGLLPCVNSECGPASIEKCVKLLVQSRDIVKAQAATESIIRLGFTDLVTQFVEQLKGDNGENAEIGPMD